MTRHRLIAVTQETGLAHWASYLINGDGSGIEDGDRAECDAWLASIQPSEPGRHAEIVSCAGESWIGHYSGPGPSRGLLADLLLYTVHVYEVES